MDKQTKKQLRKATYKAPRLTTFGRVDALTKAGDVASGMDNGGASV